MLTSTGSTGRRSGFTLIELLVVIAIIAILAAILFPVFLSAKRRGQEASCASNLKQLGLATQAYVSDYGRHDGMISAEQYYWPYAEPNPKYGFLGDSARSSGISKYIKNASFMRCPADTGKIWVDNNDHGIVVKGYYTLAWSYTVNFGVPDFLDQCPRPSRMPLWVEENVNQRIPRPDDRGNYGIINDLSFAGSDVTASKHGEGANVAFVDGHVKKLPGFWEQGLARWSDGTFVFKPGK